MEKIGIILSMGAFIVVGGVLYFLKKDYCEQKNAIEGQEYRRIFGGFSFEQCLKNKNLIKPKDWLEQKNKGKKPDEYNKKIKYVSHLDNHECVVSTRGL